jgi:hypothetical protein
MGDLKLDSVGFVGIPAQELRINPAPKIKAINNMVFLFIIKPPSVIEKQRYRVTHHVSAKLIGKK